MSTIATVDHSLVWITRSGAGEEKLITCGDDTDGRCIGKYIASSNQFTSHRLYDCDVYSRLNYAIASNPTQSNVYWTASTSAIYRIGLDPPPSKTHAPLTLLAGDESENGCLDAPFGAGSRFDGILTLLPSSTGDFLLVADGTNNKIRRVNTTTGATTTAADIREPRSIVFAPVGSLVRSGVIDTPDTTLFVAHAKGSILQIDVNANGVAVNSVFGGGWVLLSDEQYSFRGLVCTKSGLLIASSSHVKRKCVLVIDPVTSRAITLAGERSSRRTGEPLRCQSIDGALNGIGQIKSPTRLSLSANEQSLYLIDNEHLRCIALPADSLLKEELLLDVR